MKLRWRNHGMIFTAIITAIAIIGFCWQMYDLTPQQFEGGYVIPYNNAHLSFNYYRNVLIPQAGSVLLLYMCYLCINWVVVSSAKKMRLTVSVDVISKRLILIIVTALVLAFLMALGINIAIYYSHPYLFNYGGFGLLALFGYNDHPLKNIFFGFDRSIALVGIYTVIACVREAAIIYLENPASNTSYRTLVVNKITAFLVPYFAIAFFILTFNLIKGGFFESPYISIYFSFVLPAYLVFISNTYWLFPFKQETPFFSTRIIGRLLISTFIYTLPIVLCVVFVRPLYVFLISWAIQLFSVTPISWLFYKLQRDKILQLRGVEKALVKSNTDLQFLRSQVNPHFLFNALNTLYGTALQEGSERTAEGIQKLGDMMRFMLHENNLDFIPMSREIEYLQNYIALQKLRTQSSPGIIIEDNINEQNCEHKIAPMLLIPFVENAFKHGISLTERSWIKISLTCGDKNIRFIVSNSMHKHTGSDPEKERAGIGLKNVSERLKLLYPARHSFSAIGDGDEFVAELNIQA